MKYVINLNNNNCEPKFGEEPYLRYKKYPEITKYVLVSMKVDKDSIMADNTGYNSSGQDTIIINVQGNPVELINFSADSVMYENPYAQGGPDFAKISTGKFYLTSAKIKKDWGQPETATKDELIDISKELNSLKFSVETRSLDISNTDSYQSSMADYYTKYFGRR